MVFKLHFCHSASLHFMAKVQLKNHRLSQRYAFPDVLGDLIAMLKIMYIFLSAILLNGCASSLPYSEPESKYDEFEKSWKITSTRWGVDRRNIGPNPSFIRAFLSSDGTVNTHIYSRIKTNDFMDPDYALNLDGKRYKVSQVSSDVNCVSSSNCYWTQDVLIFVDYAEIAKLVDENGDFKLRVYGRVPPEDVLVLACQFWEITKEVLEIKKVDAGAKISQMGASCSE